MAEKDLSIGNGPTLRPVSASGGARRLVAGDTILGRYAVVRELGEGGMGIVYLRAGRRKAVLMTGDE